MFSRERLAKAALLITALTVVAKFVALFRDQYIAGVFGTSIQTDIYVLAMVLPDVVSNTWGGSFAVGFLPVMSGLLGAGRAKEAWRTASAFLSWSLALGAVMALLQVFFAEPVVRWLASSYSGSTLGAATAAMRIFSVGVLVLTVSNVGTMVLLAQKRYGWMESSIIIQNIITVVVVTILGTGGTNSLVFGSLAGMVAFTCIQVTVAFRKQQVRFDLSLRDDGIREVFRLGTPILFGSFMGQAVRLIERSLSTGLAAGMTTSLFYADKLRQLPLGILVSSVNNVFYPSMAEAAATGDGKAFRDTVRAGLRLMAILSFPIVVGTIIMAVPIVRILFQRGQWTPDSTISTAQLLRLYAPSMAGQTFSGFLAYALYSLKDSVRGVAWGSAGLLINVLLDMSLVRVLGAQGLALGASIATLTGAVLLLYVLTRRVPGLADVEFGRNMARIAGASAFMGFVSYGLSIALSLNAPHLSSSSILVRSIFVVGASAATYVTALILLRVNEGVSAWKAVARRFAKHGMSST